MTASFNPYAPRDQSAVDVIAYARRAIDEMARSNPLQNAVVSTGLIRWIGNYTNSSNPDKINFLWIGEFFPGDPNMGGGPQRGFSLVRDDSRGGVSAIAMFDPAPNSGGSGLRQILIITSGDRQRLFEESRDGGQRFPEETVWLGPIGDSAQMWPGTPNVGFSTLWEGRASIVGNRLRYRTFCYCDPAVAGEFRMRVTLDSGDVVGPTHVLGVGTQGVFEDEVNVAAGRGTTVALRWEGRCTAGGGGAVKARSSIISARCYSP
jgi:hypothetical protein